MSGRSVDDDRLARGPVQRKGFGPSPIGWFDPRGRALGSWAFAVNRITGLGLVFYLIVTPVRMVMSAAGNDPMNRRFDPKAETYRVVRNPREVSHMPTAAYALASECKREGSAGRSATTSPYSRRLSTASGSAAR